MKIVLPIFFACVLSVQCDKKDLNDYFEDHLGNDTVNLVMLSCFHDKEPYPVFQIRHIQFANNPGIYVDTFKTYLNPKTAELRLVTEMYADFSLRYVGKIPLLNVDGIDSVFYGPDKSVYRQYILLKMDKSLLNQPLFKVRHLLSNRNFHTITSSVYGAKVLLAVNYQAPIENIIASFNNYLTDSILPKIYYNYSPPF